MNAHELYKQYQKLESRYGVNAIEAMLRWCQRADNSLDELCRVTADMLREEIVRRELAMFDAQKEQSVYGLHEQIAAMQSAADSVRAHFALAGLRAEWTPEA